MNAAPSPVPRTVYSRRRWLQFGLRSLLGLMFVCGAGLTSWNIGIGPYRRQRRLAADIERLGGSVEFRSVDAWYARLLGEESFGNIELIGFLQPVNDLSWLPRLGHALHLKHLYLCESGLTDADLAHLRHLSRLKTLEISGNPITDAGLASLEDLTELSSLELDGTRVTDAGIARLAGRQKLEVLGLDRTDITEACLDHLGAIPALSRVSLSGTHIVPSALREALPHLDATDLAFLLDYAQTQKPFSDARLIDIMDRFSQHMIDIALDKERTKELGIDLESRFTVICNDQSMRSALQAAFEPHGLKCVYCYGVVMITTEDKDPSQYPPRLTLKRGERLSQTFSEALHSYAYVRFIDTPLADILTFFREQRGIEVRLDASSVPAHVGNSPVTCILEHTATANALELFFMDLDLYGEIENNTIHVRSSPIKE